MSSASTTAGVDGVAGSTKLRSLKRTAWSATSEMADVGEKQIRPSAGYVLAVHPSSCSVKSPKWAASMFSALRSR
jgi:hypothetical protein